MVFTYVLQPTLLYPSVESNSLALIVAPELRVGWFLCTLHAQRGCGSRSAGEQNQPMDTVGWSIPISIAQGPCMPEGEHMQTPHLREQQLLKISNFPLWHSERWETPPIQTFLSPSDEGGNWSQDSHMPGAFSNQQAEQESGCHYHPQPFCVEWDKCLILTRNDLGTWLQEEGFWVYLSSRDRHLPAAQT